MTAAMRRDDRNSMMTMTTMTRREVNNDRSHPILGIGIILTRRGHHHVATWTLGSLWTPRRTGCNGCHNSRSTMLGIGTTRRGDETKGIRDNHNSSNIVPV
jgi:hypothetical protein